MSLLFRKVNILDLGNLDFDLVNLENLELRLLRFKSPN